MALKAGKAHQADDEIQKAEAVFIMPSDASSRSSSWTRVSSAGAVPRRFESAPPPHNYRAGRKQFVPKGTQILRPLPPVASSSGYLYYVPGTHLTDRPTVWVGSQLAGHLSRGWRGVPNPTGYADLPLAINAALSLFDLCDVDGVAGCLVRTQ